VRYLELDGKPITAEDLDVVAWFRGESFLGHVLHLASHRLVLAEVRFGEPLRPPHANRRALAAAAEARVRELRGMPPRHEGTERGATA
jgi:hypothetical protein